MKKTKLFLMVNIIFVIALVFLFVGPIFAESLAQIRSGNIIFVDQSAVGLNNGTTWADAFTDLQAALGVAVKGDEIWVAEGTYYTTDTTDQSTSFSMIDGVAIYGGFAGDETVFDEREAGAHPVILSGNIGDKNVATDNSYHVIYNKELGSTAILDGFIITGGYADGADSESNGAGLYNYSSDPVLRNLTFSNNQSQSNGGGIFNTNDSNITLKNISFFSNSAYFGGGLCNNNSETSLTNVTFTENSAVYGGGMSQISASSNSTLINVTFHGNISSASGGGIQNESGTISLSNAILWGNSLSQIEGSGSVTAIYSIIQSPSVYPGDHNSNEDPLLDSLANNGGFTPTHALLPGSPAIDTGADRICPTTDQRGVPRPVDGDENGTAVCDRGSFEFNPLLFVDQTAVGLNNGTSWADAFIDLQDALAYASSGSEIWVAEGIYYPTEKTDRSISFEMKNGVAIYGGFAGTETTREERDWGAHPTTLSGNIGNSEWASDNSRHVIKNSGLDETAILNGFTITGGFARDYPPENSGGGMHNTNSHPTLTNIFFYKNNAENGGGIFNTSSSPMLSNITFSENIADLGGGMYNSASSSPTLTNITFSENTAFEYGGGMHNANSSPTLTNVTFSNNLSQDAIHYYESNLLLVNVIVWGNNTLEIAGSGSLTAMYSIIKYPNVYPGVGNSNEDPLLGPLADNGGFTQTHALQAGSPAIDAGSPTDCPVTDQRGITRPLDGDGDGTAICDVGAYEAPPIIFVDRDATGLNDGNSWADAFVDLQNARAYASSGSEIWVAEGTYCPTDTTDRSISFYLKNGVAIYGGFTGTETSRDERDWGAHPTILSGDIGTPGDNTDNSFHVVISDSVGTSAILDGFTITAGNANGENSWLRTGGGMRNLNSTPTLTNLTFSGNSAYWDGGGMFNEYSSPTLTNATFSGNTAMFGGGIVNLMGSNTKLINVTFSGNSASSGGGMFNDSSSPALINVTFLGNTAVGSGGGMYNHNGVPTLTNVTFSGNSAKWGGGIHNEDCSSTLTNVTFSSNSAEWGGGINNGGFSSPNLTNIILWGNSSPNGVSIYNRDTTSVPQISYSDVQGCGDLSSWNSDCGADGGYNIDTDPLLGPLADNGGFTQTHALLSGSPAIDAGSPTICPATDQRGITRPLDGDGDGTAVCDMGAYEVVPVYGKLKIKKVFTPLASGFTGTFTISYDCDDGTAHDGTVTLAAGESATISDIPVGTTCTVTEDTLPTAPNGWRFGIPTFNPGNGQVKIDQDDQVYSVTVTNSIYPVVAPKFELFIPLIMGD